MGAHAVVSWLLGPLSDPHADDNVSIKSDRIKAVCLALTVLGLGITAVLIVVCAATGPNDLRAGVTVAWILVLWVALCMMIAGLFASHPYYKAKMKQCARWRREHELPNPLLDPEDEEISI